MLIVQLRYVTQTLPNRRIEKFHSTRDKKIIITIATELKNFKHAVNSAFYQDVSSSVQGSTVLY